MHGDEKRTLPGLERGTAPVGMERDYAEGLSESAAITREGSPVLPDEGSRIDTLHGIEPLPVDAVEGIDASGDDATHLRVVRDRAQEEVTSFLENTIGRALHTVDMVAQGMEGYHDPRWQKVLQEHRRKENIYKTTLERIDRGDISKGNDRAAIASEERMEREFQREVKNRIEAFGRRDQFLASARNDLRGVKAALFGSSPSESREVAFLNAALGDRAIPLSDYVEFLSEERQRVAQDRSLNFFARTLRGVQLAHRENIARAHQGIDEVARRKQSQYFPDEPSRSWRLNEELASRDRNTQTTQGKRELVEAEFVEDQDPPTVEAPTVSNKPDDIAEADLVPVNPTGAEGAFVEGPTLVAVPEEDPPLVLEDEDDPEDLGKFLEEDAPQGKPSRQSESTDTPLAASGDLAEATKATPPPLMGLRGLPVQERRRQVFLRSLVVRNGEDFAGMEDGVQRRERILLDQLRDDYDVEIAETRGEFSPMGDLDDIEPGSPKEKSISAALEAAEERALVEEMRRDSIRLTHTVLDAEAGDVVEAHMTLYGRLEQAENGYRAAAMEREPDFSYIRELSRRIIELRLAIAEIERIGAQQGDPDVAELVPAAPYIADEKTIIPPLAERRSTAPSVPQKPPSFFSRWGKRIALATALLLYPSSIGHESAPSQPRAGEDVEDVAPPEDERVEYVTGSLQEGGTVWHQAEEVLKEAGISHARQKELVFLTRIILDGNHIGHAEDLPVGQELDLTRAAHLAKELKAGVDVDDLWHQLGYEGEVTL